MTWLYRGLFVEILVQFRKLIKWDFVMRSVKTGFFGIIIAALLTAPTTAIPGIEIPEDRDTMGLSQALKRLDVVASVLHTGAHPDDENSALLAWLARGQAVRKQHAYPQREARVV
jgi:hypothetical protein